MRDLQSRHTQILWVVRDSRILRLAIEDGSQRGFPVGELVCAASANRAYYLHRYPADFAVRR